MQQARGYQGAVRQMRPRFDQASRESSRVVGARRLAGCPQSRQGFSQALVAWLPSNQELWYASPHDGRALPPPVFIRPSRDTRSRGPKWTRSICSATAVYHENRERTGEYPGYRRERNYLEHSACPQERHSSRSAFPHFRSRAVLETLCWVTPSSKRGSQSVHSRAQQPLGTTGIACTAAILAEAQRYLFPVFT